MSLVSTWVQGTDAQYYKNPEIEKDDFFICFDDEEEPEIVIALPSDAMAANEFRDRASRYRRAADLLKSLNIPYRITKYGLTCTRIFGEFSLKPAFSVHFALKGPLPVKCITKFDRVTQKPPKGDCVIYHFLGEIEWVSQKS